MNTTVLHEEVSRPVSWKILYEDGTDFSSTEGTWNEQATYEDIDGLALPVSEKRVCHLIVFQEQGLLLLPLSFTPPIPTQMFAFTRRSAPVGHLGSDQWLYTLFGYNTDDTRVLLVVGPVGISFSTPLRSEPFFL